MTINFKNLSTIKSNLNSFPKSKLIIVTKNQTKDDVEKLLINDFYDYGENRIQEASKKYDLKTREKFQSFNLHLIGPLQSNKTSSALQIFDTIQTLDRKKIINSIVKETNRLNFVRTKDYFIQVNIGNEPQKSGCLPEETSLLYDYAKSFNLNVIGLMCIPPNDAKPEFYFNKMVILRNSINSKLLLSMGMSNDYEIALKYDANFIRIGSKIFA